MTYRLCFIRGNAAWFTPLPLSEQWGDDWNDSPYDCNAGTPYESERGLYKVYFEAFLEQPCDVQLNCGLSVNDINKGKSHWLATSRFAPSGTPSIRINAGCSLDQFISLVELVGGEVYEPKLGR